LKPEDDGGQKSKIPGYIQAPVKKFIMDGFKWRTDNAEAPAD